MHKIDSRGLKCPLPILKLEKYLANNPKTINLELLADDEMAIIDIQHYCNRAKLFCEVKKRDNYFSFFIRNKVNQHLGGDAAK